LIELKVEPEHHMWVYIQKENKCRFQRTVGIGTSQFDHYED